jgi:hypothetical protein
MPLEGLAKTKTKLTPKIQTKDPKMWPTVTWEHKLVKLHETTS